jgi:hypothetical protein
VELTAIQMAMQQISGQEAERSLIQTDSLTACWIVRKAATTEKKIIVKWIPAHVGISGNEKADELAKKGTTDGTPTQYKLQLKDLYRQIENDLLENWNRWFSTTSTVKGRWYNDIERQVGKDPYCNTNRNTRTINQIITGHAPQNGSPERNDRHRIVRTM